MTLSLFDPPKRKPRTHADRLLIWQGLTEDQRKLIEATIRRNPLFSKRPVGSWLLEGACLALMETMLAAGEIAVEGN